MGFIYNTPRALLLHHTNYNNQKNVATISDKYIIKQNIVYTAINYRVHTFFFVFSFITRIPNTLYNVCVCVCILLSTCIHIMYCVPALVFISGTRTLNKFDLRRTYPHTHTHYTRYIRVTGERKPIYVREILTATLARRWSSLCPFNLPPEKRPRRADHTDRESVWHIIHTL